MTLPWRKLGLMVGAIVLVLCAAELGLRQFLPQPGYDYPRGYFVREERCGYVLAPGAWGRIGPREASYDGAVSSLGLRNAELGAKQGTRPRVLVIGDSCVYGSGVEPQETFVARLNCLSPELEFVNAGVPGYNTRQEAQFLARLTPQLGPDVCLLVFFEGNDILGNLRVNPDAVVRGVLWAGKPESNEGWFDGLAFETRFLLEQLHLYRLVRRVPEAVLGVEPQFSGLYATDLHPQRSEIMARAWECSAAALDQVRMHCEQARMALLLATLPAMAQVDPRQCAARRPAASVAASPQDMDWPGLYLGQWAAQHDIPFCDLRADLRAAVARGENLFLGRDLHYNARGHEVQARALARFVRAALAHHD
ncbi:MAG: GDSL-type esterase/lipase family protein [Planctomycetota bacterium]